MTSLFLLLLTGAPPPDGPGPVFCLGEDRCPSSFHCHWGICLPDLAPDPGPLFTIGVGPLADLAPAGGAGPSVLHVRETLTRLLAASGFFRARLQASDSGLHDQPEELALAGIAYQVRGRLVPIDGGRSQLTLELLNTTASRGMPLLGLEHAGTLSDLDPALTAWVNRLVLHFTGRPGILGTRIACVRKDDQGVKEVVVFAFGDDESRPVTRDGSLAVLPSWTPDGRVAYTSFKSGRALIYVEGIQPPFADYPPMATGIHWSPDGSRAALTLIEDDNSEIFLLEGASAAKMAQLTRHAAIDTSPRFSPDGRSIAFVSDRSGTPQIYLMDTNGLDKRRLTMEGSYNTSPAWHPNGRFIAYTSRRGGFQIDLYDLETNLTLPLTDGAGDSEEPSFSPDGRYIVYTYAYHGRRDLHIMNADGTASRRINRDDGRYFSPAWEWPR